MNKILLGLVMTFISVVAAADHVSPETVVRETTNEVLAWLDAEKTELATNPDRLKQLVRELIIPHFDFDTMSRLALGMYWKYLDENQRSCFNFTFRNILVERYAYILLSYDKQTIHYRPAQPIGRLGYMTVVQEITLKNNDVIPVEYPMRPLEDGWKVIDLIIDDISLVRSHRTAYQEEIKSDGLDVFLEENLDCDYRS